MNDTVERLRRVLAEDPDSRQFVALGRALADDGALDEAVQVLEEGLRRHPRLAEGWVVLAGVQLERGELRAVETACARALDVDSENAEAARLIARAASRRGDWRRALSAWRLTLALAPGDAEAGEGIAEAERNLAGPDAVSSATAGEARPRSGAAFEGNAAGMPRPALPREVVTITSGEDPFRSAPMGDTGVWATEDDVFAVESSTAPEPVAEPGGPFGEPEPPEVLPEPPGAGEAPPFEPEEPLVLAEQTEAREPAAEAAGPVAQEAGNAAAVPVEAPDPWPVEGAPDEVPPVGPETLGLPPDGDEMAQPGGESAVKVGAVPDGAAPSSPPGTPEGMPLPTVTLARLALEQGDPELARRTLEQVVALKGETEETIALADRIRAAETGAGAATLAERKIERLQGWMRAVRLAAESRDHGIR